MKKNSSKWTMILTTVICLIPVIAGIILYPKLPDTIATHWDLDGTPNGWSSKLLGTIIYPAGLAFLNVLFPLLLKTDPRYQKYDERVKYLLHWLFPLITVFCSGTTLAAATGRNLKVATMAFIFLGVILIAIGNYLPKTIPSYMTGIRLPWTLHSEENWNRTHRMAGFLWVIGGAIMIISAVANFGKIAFLAIIVLMIAIPTVYSYLLYKKGI